MVEKNVNEYMPDYAVHPGEILEETLEARRMKRVDLAQRCHLSPKTISQIINGKASITPETAIQLERVLGVSANVWNNLDANYRLRSAKIADRRKLKRGIGWVRKFPIKELVKMGFLIESSDPAETVERMMDFMGIGSIEAWEESSRKMAVAYRRSPAFRSSPESVAAWLRIGQRLAENIDAAPYERDKFRSALNKIRMLTTEQPEDFEPQMKHLCREAGVALVFVSELHRTHLSGATRWIDKDKALIILSLRYKSNDHFWFTFFHEAAHILLHGKRVVFLDEEGMELNKYEEEANRFAADILIPRSKYEEFTAKGRFRQVDTGVFAQEIGIAPGIVVGRLQHDKKIPFNRHNRLKRRFEIVWHNP